MTKIKWDKEKKSRFSLKRIIAITTMVCVLVLTLAITNRMSYNEGYTAGFKTAIERVRWALEQQGARVSISEVAGAYAINITFIDSIGVSNYVTVKYELHLLVEQFRDGRLISISNHPMSLTNAGKDWLEGIIGNAVGADVAKYIAISNDSSVFDAAWTAIPNEITTGNMGRAAATYASTGIGTWNETKVFSPSESNSSKLYGLYYTSTGAGLLAAEQQGVANQKNYISGDTLQPTVQGTIS